MVHAIIFDMDGVLIDSQPMHYLGDQQTLAAHGVDVPVEAMTAYAGTTNQLRFELFKERYHLSETIDSLIAEREAIMIRLVRESDAGPTAGSVELLKSIKAAGLKTAVASSSSYPFEKLKETPETCVVIEDSANGVLAAVRAGMTCLGYQNPTSGEQDLSKANAVINDFRTIDADFLIHLSEKNDIVH